MGQYNFDTPAADDLRPIAVYDKRVESGMIRHDNHQRRIILKLQALHDQLLRYHPPPIAHHSPSGFLTRLFSPAPTGPAAPPADAPKGLYLFGDVGTGKTMLMDLFYSTLPPSITRKRRVHFHAFMIDVHKRIHAAKQHLGRHGGDPIAPVARDLAEQAYVLCFDEFQVTDIADAMILRRLLETLLNHGVVIVMTSNRHPDDLYKNGIQRSSFIPAIELLKSHFEVTDLDSGTDYRRIPRALSQVYFDPLTEENKREVEKIFESLTDDPADPIELNRELETWGRKIIVPESTKRVAKFSFHDLCGKPMSAADYIKVTETFDTIFLMDVPKMGLESKDMARRFITFIDACYESKTKLFVTSEVPIYQVFSDEGQTASDQLQRTMEEMGVSTDLVGASSITYARISHIREPSRAIDRQPTHTHHHHTHPTHTPIMTKNVTKVAYKPDTQSTDEYLVIVNADEYKRWKDGDTTIPLVEVVDSFDVFHSGQGNQGILGRASKQQLDTVFGTTKDDEVVAKILKDGQTRVGDKFDRELGSKLGRNAAIGGNTIDNRGKGLQGI
ncbi:AFG1-like ATPase-domain-containing protein [Schizophyllum commune]